jgi:hypothetical protein
MPLAVAFNFIYTVLPIICTSRDNISYQPTIWGIVILVCGFPDTDALSGHDGSLGALIALLILYGTAVSGFTYCVSFFLSSPTVAAIFVFMGGFILGLILSVVGVFLRIINDVHPNDYQYYLKVVRYIFCLIPFYCLGDGLNNLSFRSIFSLLELEGGEQYDPLDWKMTGCPIAFLAWETVFYLSCAILYEYLVGLPSVRALFCAKAPPPVDNSVKDEGMWEFSPVCLCLRLFCMCGVHRVTFLMSRAHFSIIYFFVDVLAEEDRVRTGAADDDSVILVKDMKKVYPGGKFAVRGVSLGIPNGECFGLLGEYAHGCLRHCFYVLTVRAIIINHTQALTVRASRPPSPCSVASSCPAAARPTWLA